MIIMIIIAIIITAAAATVILQPTTNIIKHPGLVGSILLIITRME